MENTFTVLSVGFNVGGCPHPAPVREQYNKLKTFPL